MTTIFLSAGDASGELHTAALVESLRERVPEARFLGLGGAAMEEAGVDLAVHQREIAIGGLVEVLKDAGTVVGAWRRLGRALRGSRPDLVVLVDSPDFNMPFSLSVRKLGIPILYYVSPQVWAWRRYRIQKIARRVDRMAVIFPFEVDVYAGTGLPVEFVGHPLVERFAARPAPDRTALRTELGHAGDDPLVALLPGSRRNEIRDSLPLQIRTARALRARLPAARFALAVAPSIPRAAVEAALAAIPEASDLGATLHEDRTYDVISAADVALTKPGTVTVEIALLGTPMVVAARANPITAAIGRRVVKVPSLTMVNLIAGAPVVPEFVQEAAQPERVAGALEALLTSKCGPAQRARLAEVCARLGGGGASRRTAQIALSMLEAPR
jgi:lipid-A-disaccharide synthase